MIDEDLRLLHGTQERRFFFLEFAKIRLCGTKHHVRLDEKYKSGFFHFVFAEKNNFEYVIEYKNRRILGHESGH